MEQVIRKGILVNEHAHCGQLSQVYRENIDDICQYIVDSSVNWRLLYPIFILEQI